MATFVQTNSRLFVGGADLTNVSRQAEFTAEIADADVTNMGSGGAEEYLGGLLSSAIEANGQWDAGDPTLVDDALWAALANRGIGPWSLCPQGALDLAPAYLGQIHEASYQIGGEVGDVAPWSVTGTGSGIVGRGQVAHPPGTSRTTSGSGVSLNLGAVAAGRFLVAAVHILSVTGTLSITPRIETDDATGFPSATTVATGTAVVAAGAPSGQWLASSGAAITDTFQRLAWTISGSGTCLFAATIGIG